METKVLNFEEMEKVKGGEADNAFCLGLGIMLMSVPSLQVPGLILIAVGCLATSQPRG